MKFGSSDELHNRELQLPHSQFSGLRWGQHVRAAEAGEPRGAYQFALLL